jgi:Ca-activated chloride channel family protein
VHLYAVGIGSPAGVPLPAFDEHGVQRGYRKDAAGHVVVTRLDRQGLDKIARAGGGEAFWQPRGVAVGEVVQRIEAMQKSDLETRRVTSYIERYQWPLAAGLLLTMIGMALPTSARARRRRGAAAKVASAAALVVAMLLAGRADAAGLLHRPEAATARGTAAYGRGDYAAALAAFQAAHPKGGDAAVEYDRGTALFKLGRYQEAKAAFARSAALAPRAQALYDLGNTEAALKDETGAIATYRKALGVDPNDEAARHNLEVLLQKKEDEKKKQQQQQDKKQQAGNQQKKDQSGKGDQQKQQQQAGNQQKKDQNGKGDQQKQQQQAGNQQKKDQNGKGDQQKQQQQQAGNEPKQEQNGAGAQQQQQAAQPAPPTGHPLDRAAQARADARLTPGAARILDSMRAVDRTLPLSRFAPPTPRSAHEKDW